MRAAWMQFSAGAVLSVAAIVGFVVSFAHRPDRAGGPCPWTAAAGCHSWTQSAYDGVRLGSWACVMTGLILTLVGFIVTRRRGGLRAGAGIHLRPPGTTRQ